MPATARHDSGALSAPTQVEVRPEVTLPQWYALYTRSHSEQLVFEQLVAKRYHLFLPKLEKWSHRAGKRHLVYTPMFPGYLFLRHRMDKESYIDIRATRGLVCVLGKRWDRLSVVPDVEIAAIDKVLQARFPVFPHGFLREGQRVRITQGPLTGVEGIFVQYKPTKGLLVLSVELLHRSVAVEVDCRLVTAA